MRYEYARLLEQQGRLREAREQYELAAQTGHLASLIRLKQTTFTSPPDETAAKPTAKKRAGLRGIGSLLLFLFVFHLLAEPIGFDRLFSLYLFPHTKPGDLPLLVVENARTRYFEATGHQPAALSDLTNPQPVNFLSSLSPDLLKATGCPCEIRNATLELHYYPDANQLALVRGDEILTLYQVASGPPLPFERSAVSRRVVNPNGGHGPWGTRGLELEDGYAIHGTNQLEVIGQSNVTKGCLRLRNVDIETLYPYISLGTPFAVIKGRPKKPTFPEGLPPLGELLHPAEEETPGVVYHWKE